MTHPYSEVQPYQLWYKAMANPPPGHIDPVVVDMAIAPQAKVATMGSCFAQHLGRDIARAGFNYFVTEQRSHGSGSAEAKQTSDDSFSARYGNVYTARQALQLFERAFGSDAYDGEVWIKNERFIDPFRPQIEPEGFLTTARLLEDRASHLRCVRKIFEESDWLIFTLGLTEAWRSKANGAIYPVAPGLYGGRFEEAKHEFVNFTAMEVCADLKELCCNCRRVNTRLKIILTISPVPLLATYEKRHVLVSSTVSKAALRVAAEEVLRTVDNLIYFPAYEIITSPAAGGRYYQDDLRQVTDVGVSHVMRVFYKHFGGRRGVEEMYELRPSEMYSLADSIKDVECDEELIEGAIEMAGFQRKNVT